MDRVIFSTLVIALLTGFSRGQDLLPAGPVYGYVGGKASFTPITPAQPLDTIIWSFGSVDVVIFTPPGPPSVHSNYINRVSLKISGALELTKLTTADFGVYSLTLTPDGGGPSKRGEISLQVVEPITSVALLGPEEILVEGESFANFTCSGNGTIFTTEWMKDGQIVVSSGSISFSADNRSMVISPVRRSDTGEYQCTLQNLLSSATANYSMTVNYGPDVNILGVKTVEEGSDILLYCSADSHPPATLTWTVNGNIAGHSALYVIENCNMTHSGNYTCSAHNNITGVRASVYIVTVTSKNILSAGAAVGITVGVILGLQILAVALFFLVKRFNHKLPCSRKSADPVGKEEEQDKHNIKTSSPQQDNEGARREVMEQRQQEILPHQAEHSGPCVPMKPMKPMEPSTHEKLYENTNQRPALPPRSRPERSPLNDTNDSNTYSTTINDLSM